MICQHIAANTNKVKANHLVIDMLASIYYGIFKILIFFDNQLETNRRPVLM